MDDGSVLQVLDILFGLVEARRPFRFGRSALYQLDEVVAVNFVHDAEHAAAVVADPLQVLAFAGVGVSCGWRGNVLLLFKEKCARVTNKISKSPFQRQAPDPSGNLKCKD